MKRERAEEEEMTARGSDLERRGGGRRGDTSLEAKVAVNRRRDGRVFFFFFSFKDSPEGREEERGKIFGLCDRCL